MRATIRTVQYNGDNVAVLIENPLSQFFINLSQTDLSARAGGGNWGDAEVLAATTERIAIEHPELAWEVEFAPAPAPVAEATPGAIVPVSTDASTSNPVVGSIPAAAPTAQP